MSAPAASFKTLLLAEQKNILSVQLNRPDLRNALSSEMIGELTTVFQGIATRADLRGVFFSGAGKAFCAGADLNDMQKAVSFSMQQNQDDALRLHGLFEAIYSCPVPVVTMVQGAAFGGALGLIAASDLVLVEEKTQLCFSEVLLGLAPAVISDFVLRKIPLGFVTPWMLTGHTFSGGEALRMGLAHFHADHADLRAHTDRILQNLCDAGPEAVRETKKLIQKVPGLSRDQARTETTQVIAARRVSSEGQEGLNSFLEKRKPAWRLS